MKELRQWLQKYGSKASASALRTKLWDASLHNTVDACKLLLKLPQIRRRHDIIANALENDIIANALENDIIANALENDIIANALENDIIANALENDIIANALENDIIANALENDIIANALENDIIANALENACRHDSLAVVEFFVNEMHMNDSKTLKKALIISSKSGSLDVVEFLIEKMNLSYESECQIWRLIAACALNCVGKVKENAYLIEGKVIIGRPILEAAYNKGSLRVVEWILQNRQAELNLLLLSHEETKFINDLLVIADLNGHKKF